MTSTTLLIIADTIAGLAVLRFLSITVIRADRRMHQRWIVRLEADLARERALFALHEVTDDHE